jgi:hypothetical protein
MPLLSQNKNIVTMVRLICQPQEGGLKQTNLKQLFRALEHSNIHSCSRHTGGKRKPLRSSALLALDINKLIADYNSGIAPYSLAIKYGIDRETVAKRLRDAGVRLRAQQPQ